MATPMRGVPLPEARNPFAGKGLAITLALLLEPDRRWTLAELALHAQVSRPLVTKVIESLRRWNCVEGDVSQGRRAAVHATPTLFHTAASHWPTAAVWVLGGRVPRNLPTGGGPVVSEALGLPWDAPPRVYVRSRTLVPGVLARAGGNLVSEPVAEWGISIVDYPFAPGPLPRVAALLELGASPRGREMLDRLRGTMHHAVES